MLTVKEVPAAAAGAGGAATAAAAPLRFGAAQLTPLLQPLLTSLFGVLKTDASKENAYVMRAVMRVTVVAAEGMAPYATPTPNPNPNPCPNPNPNPNPSPLIP
jgi:hypothetical protein